MKVRFNTFVLVCFGTVIIFFTSSVNVFSQLCGPNTPTFIVNLTGNPNGLYTSPSVQRNDTCCGATAPDVCVQFIVTLDPSAVGMIFTVCNGAVPPGALYYQVNCGPPQPVGTGICISPPYPDTITFCKPGNNQNQYCIQSVAPPTVVTLSQNCSALMWTFGFDEPSIVWTSIFPGPNGAYNSYLSCVSGCDSTWVTPQPGYPPYIDYQVCGTVTNGCSQNFCDTIRVNFPPVLTTSVTPTNVLCYGGNNGSAAASTTGGIPSYTYSWSSSGGSTSTATGLTAGNYTCIITDAAGCTMTTTVAITQPPPLAATYTTNPATCSQSNGSASVSPSGGTPVYTYQWLNGQTTATATGLVPGVYPVTIGDANGCTFTVNVPVSNVLPVVTVTSTTVTCNGGSNGSATSNASGGIPPYTYQWSNGQTTSTATGLSAGSYTIATSSSGCINYNIVTIPQPAALTGTLTAQNNVSCNGGNNGNVTINYSGGTPGYSYQWSNGQTTPSATGLTAGNYTLIVTDANGCTKTNTVIITQPPLLSSSASSQTNVLCNGANTGSAAVTAAGGTTPYAYSWSSGQTTSSISNLTAGNYSCTTTDANGCTVTTTLTITQPPALITTVSGNPNTCFGQNDTLSASVTGGIPGYTYAWSPSGGNTTIAIVSPTASTTYTLQITDANGCTTSSTVSATINPLPAPAFFAPPVCLNNQTLFSNQSTGGAQWFWDFGEPSSGPANNSTQQNPGHTYSSSGIFTVTLIVTNSFGCSDSITQTIFVNPLPFVNFSPTTVCVGITSQFTDLSTISSGSVVSWSWNFGDPPSGPNNISNLQNPAHFYATSGLYVVLLTVASNSGCQNSITLPVYVAPPPTANFTATDACFNSANGYTDASLGASQWYWQFGDLTASTLQNPTHVYANTGTFVVTLIATSVYGCKDTVSDTVTVHPLPNPNFLADTVCPGTGTSFTDLSTVASGTLTDWAWNFNDLSPTDTAQNPTHIFFSSGTYNVSLTVTSSDNCQNTASISVLVYSEPNALFSASSQTLTDFSETVSLTNLSSSDVVQWYWSFGDSTFLSPNQPNPSHQYSDTGQFIITLVVMNQYGCRDTVELPITVREFSFYIPTAFTPNGNGLNDSFFGVGLGILEYEMWIFDRWGNLIFHCKVNDLPQSPYCQWDGKVRAGSSNEVVQQDVYVWKVVLLDMFKNERQYVGNVTVVK